VSVLCFLALLVAAATSLWLTILIVGAQVTRDGLFKGWRDVLDAFELADSPRAWLGLVVCLSLDVLRILIRTGRWAALAAYYTAAFGGAGAVCGIDWVSMIKEIRKLLQDFYDFVRAGRIKNVAESSVRDA